jgi:hypothetical protein
MTRDAAIALACAVADAGYSCSVAIGVHPKMMPVEHCSVSVHALRLDASALRRLLEVGDRHRVELAFGAGNGGISFVAAREETP